MVSDGSHYRSDIFRRHVHPVKESEGHDCTALGVVYSVYDVADVMQISGDFDQLDFMFGVTESMENLGSSLRYFGYVSKAVLSIAESKQ